MHNILILITFNLILGSISAQASLTEQRLKAFRSNPKAFMNSLPYKTGAQSTKHITVEDKIKYRQRLMNYKSGGNTYSLKYFLDNGSNFLRNVEEIHSRGLTTARLDIEPWSSDYWPIADGILANRYEDYRVAHGDWKDQYEWFQENTADQYFENGEQDLLSPAEKYDLLTGHDQFPFTAKMWQDGKYYYDQNGEVESWMGICHGWAPAAYMVAEPKKVVKVHLVNKNADINFYPHDLKGLASLLWANSRFETRFIGSRCNDKDPEQDENGRIIDEECFDNNPGIWHMAVVNQIGVSKRSFVLDATYDYQVWNQPIFEYEFFYFNVTNDLPSRTIEEALVPIEEYKNDPFKKYRSPKAKYILGIDMDLTYVVETSPTHARSYFNPKTTVSYLYDLELDENMNIIGGEWYQNTHPDFLWSVPKGSRAQSTVDFYLSNLVWRDNYVVSDREYKVLQFGSENGLISNAVLDWLINQSK